MHCELLQRCEAAVSTALTLKSSLQQFCLSVRWSFCLLLAPFEAMKSQRKAVLISPQLARLSMAYRQHPQHSSVAIWSILSTHFHVFSCVFAKIPFLSVLCRATSACTRVRTALWIFSLNYSGQRVSTDAHPNNWKACPLVFIKRWKLHMG